MPNWATRQIAHYQQEVWRICKLLHWDEMSRCPLSLNARADLIKSNALARALFYFVSFIFDHPVVWVAAGVWDTNQRRRNAYFSRLFRMVVITHQHNDCSMILLCFWFFMSPEDPICYDTIPNSVTYFQCHARIWVIVRMCSHIWTQWTCEPVYPVNSLICNVYDPKTMVKVVLPNLRHCFIH